ncbi:hypothetical protein NM688_g8053 [Phlebia brevispora]|uniref:Uncharacterized protein n=1 Tax=Phlebia brevispora TaxID=194682 RepID=A0ACC1RXX3_9APHY|nr:hypothetical protein NM688_g8053 [Phlebia brevispora]
MEPQPKPPAEAKVVVEPRTQAQVPVEPKAIVEENGSGMSRREEPMPPERVRSRASSRPSTSTGTGSPSVELPPLPLSTLGDPRLFTPPEKKYSKHRSFILSHKSDVLANHFAMIDRELFLHLKFEELVSQDYVNTTDDLNVLDWAQYLRERARMRAEGHKPNDLNLIRSRFNLMANFVASEIVLTNPGDRLMIHSKFVRIAWKSYSSKSFNALVAILAGLDNHWVKRALHQAGAKLGIWETRMLRDLQQWCTSDDDFRHIRQTVEALSEAKSVVAASQDTSTPNGDPQTTSSSRSRAASELKPPQPPACVPFFGIYLSQLHRFSVLPDLIDPTAPNEPVGVDPETNTFEPPAHPEIFANLAPLPPSVQLEPLINVHKQRLIAGVVKSFVAAQHLAVKVQHPTDKKLFQKCLKLRGLDDDTFYRALAVYSGSDS